MYLKAEFEGGEFLWWHNWNFLSFILSLYSLHPKLLTFQGVMAEYSRIAQDAAAHQET